MAVNTANIQFNENGTPVAQQFDDVYFSNIDGLRETEYVFIKGAQLLERWQQHSHQSFVIAETGFGTGLNFLATWRAFDSIKNTDLPFDTLHFITFEKYPLSQQDLRKALSRWTELTHYSEQLLEQYPPAVSGCHRLIFAQGKVILDIWLGDIHDSLPELINTQANTVDTWFLDGFAPSKNPDMWNMSLYTKMAKLSKADTTFATFTAAGDVRRQLIAAGFAVSKRKGFKYKREMLVGRYTAAQSQSSKTPYYVRSRASTGAKTVTIIGGGLAAASTCYSLAQRGFNIDIICRDNALASQASGNRQGGFYPQLQSQFNPPSALHAHGYLFASRYYQALNKQSPFIHDWCGVLQIAFNDATLDRYQKVVNCNIWPEQLVNWITPEQTTQKAGVPLPYPSLHFADGGWINVASVVESLVNASRQLSNVSVQYNTNVTALNHHNDHWEIATDNSETRNSEIVVLACGADTQLVQQLSPTPLKPVRGQVEFPKQTTTTKALKAVLCHKGYMTPAYQGQHTIGSTYIKDDNTTDYRCDEQASIQAMTEKALNDCDWVSRLNYDGDGRAAVRCTSPDHLPVVGAMPDTAKQQQVYHGLSVGKRIAPDLVGVDHKNLFTLTCLGSRGLCTAPLMAELLASQINGEFLPLSTALLNCVNPNRFLIRSLIRGEEYAPLKV